VRLCDIEMQGQEDGLLTASWFAQEFWPRNEMMPQKPFVHLDPPLKKRKRSNLKLPAG